jgi:hypothetical protein
MFFPVIIWMIVSLINELIIIIKMKRKIIRFSFSKHLIKLQYILSKIALYLVSLTIRLTSMDCLHSLHFDIFFKKMESMHEQEERGWKSCSTHFRRLWTDPSSNMLQWVMPPFPWKGKQWITAHDLLLLLMYFFLFLFALC